jgi:hypothetical protein
MDPSEYVQPVHFRELHLLPRVIFSVGAALFIGSFFVKSLILGLCGIALIFAGTLYNLIVDTALEWAGKHKLNCVMVVHCIIAASLAIGTICLAHHLRANAPTETLFCK